MKRFFLAVVFCTSLLGALSTFLFPSAAASENPLLTLLNLPSPPPPNPQVSIRQRTEDENFFSRTNPPPDDAPIEVLMEYWGFQSRSTNEQRYKLRPSEKVLERLLSEVEKDPSKLGDIVHILPRSARTADLVKEVYEKTSSGTETERELRAQLKRWLKYNTPYFGAELERDARRVADQDDYIVNHRSLIQLARVDWDRAEPIVNRLYNNPGQPASRTAALWAMYVHALESGSPSDTDRYRDELKDIISDRSLSPGIRDLALDALSMEKEWSGRDEWYASLMEDETLGDLGRFTGLTTLITFSPEDKYVDRMIALLRSDNINVRSAAARNLLVKQDVSRPDVLTALLPWLENSKWLRESTPGREALVRALGRMKLPESVPGLIAALDEKDKRQSYAIDSSASNYAAANRVGAASNTGISSNKVSNSSVVTITETYYPLRYSAVTALGFQRDGRAVPALRRILGEPGEPYERQSIIGAIFECGGFTLAEQVDALEHIAKEMGVASRNAELQSNAKGTVVMNLGVGNSEILDVKGVLGLYISLKPEIDDELGRAIIERIGQLEKSDPPTADALRRLITKWSGPAINALLLRDLKNNKIDADAIVKLLSIRKDLREHQPQDIFDLRTGAPIALGISSCLLEDGSDQQAILDGENDEAKTAMLACARLIRSPLPVEKVAAWLQSKNKLLALAAERYLESEDSPQARRTVLSLHPGEAKILGATTAFYPIPRDGEETTPFLMSLFATVNEYFTQPRLYVGSYEESATGEIEKRFQSEVKSDPDILGLYSWEQNSIRIYKDRVLLNWEEDPARYRERQLTKEEFDQFKALLSYYRADELPPFLSCGNSGEECHIRELLMLGRNGGRRLFVKVDAMPTLFSDLDRMFADMRRPPSVIKYWAGRDIPGLQLLFASDQLDAKAVWKNGADIRLLTADKVRRAEIDNDLEAFAADLPAPEEETLDEDGEDGRVEAEKSKREYENLAWNNFVDGSLGAVTSQPSQVEIIPTKDSFSIAASEHRWKAHIAAIEIRADRTGLYKIVAGKMTKIRNGSYSDPVLTPNGRWVIASKYGGDFESQLVRVNLLNNREVVVPASADGLESQRAYAFVASMNRVLVGLHAGEDFVDEIDDSNRAGFSLLDPETGSLIPARGEFRPLVQQTFRALQPTANAFEFWAAIPNKDDTVIGLYNTRIFTFKPLLKLPRIRFDSMDMWVDGSTGNAYFVYEGHLLVVPVKNGR